MIRVGVVGATGYAGAELVRILAGHEKVQLTVLTSRQHAGAAFSDVYPAMAGIVDTALESYHPEQTARRADLFFLALPHKLPMTLVPDLLQREKRVIDLSADFRFSDAASTSAPTSPTMHRSCWTGPSMGCPRSIRSRSGPRTWWETPAAIQPAYCCRWCRFCGQGCWPLRR